jgi:hypothetical protein
MTDNNNKILVQEANIRYHSKLAETYDQTNKWKTIIGCRLWNRFHSLIGSFMF